MAAVVLAALLGAVSALFGVVVNIVVPKLWNMTEENHELREGLVYDIEYIQRELAMIMAAITEHQSPSEELREVAYDMADCIERFMHRVARERKPWLFGLRKTNSTMKTRTAKRFAREIQDLRTRLEDERRRHTDPSSTPAPSASGAGAATTSAPQHREVKSPQAGRLVGMDGPCTDLLELVRGRPECQRKRELKLVRGRPECQRKRKLKLVRGGRPECQWERGLKVISIVGFGGLGKTLLAKQVCNRVEGEFKLRAWVRAADRGAEEVLSDILKQILKETGVPDNPSTSDVHQQLRSCLGTTKLRYLIVIDDIRMSMADWRTIESAFPDTHNVGSRIIVTTTIQSVATSYSANGYVFKMTPLDEEQSKGLFFESASLEEPSPAMEQDAAEILKKCDGLPLALVSMAHFLQNNGGLTSNTYKDACSRLGAYLEEEQTLERLQWVLLNKYTGLSSHVLKVFLLHFCLFPCDKPIRRNSLIRRWQAEGFVEAQPGRGTSGSEERKLEILIDRNIIHPMDVSNNGKVKRCQPSGMMLEYISYKCMSENFCTFPDQTSQHRYIRRLSLHHDMRAPNGRNFLNLSRLRTLVVSGLAGEATLNFYQSKLLRVLDLEECCGLNNRHLENICMRLQLLKYLSLGDGISEVPRKIARLRNLETLDLRRAKVETVPVEVIELPQLKHLLGKFRLFKLDSGKSKLVKFLSEESNLETLAGFVIDESRGFPELMIHMPLLRKVKVCCKSTADSTNLNHLSEAIREFISKGTTNTAADLSLSIDFNECRIPFLEFLGAPGSLSSLKLRGKLGQFPTFVTTLTGIQELCLSWTTLRGDLILAGLSHLRILKYLKLVEDNILGAVVIQPGQFPSLERICLVGVQSLPRITVEGGALPFLVSLHLLCPSLVGLSVVGIEHLKSIKEVALHSGVAQETKDMWKEAARGHRNRPNVLSIQSP